MSNSKLVTYTKKSPNYTAMSNKKNTHIVIHHMAGKLTVKQCGNIFASSSRQASSNYGVSGKEVGLYVDEKNRSWATSSREIDSKAVTIETANSTLSPKWEVSATTMQTLIKLCVDICKRNGIKKLNYTGNKNGNLHLHQWYSSTNCPGPYLKGKMKYIAEQVNKQLTTTTAKKTTTTKTTAKVIKSGKVTASALNVRNNPTVANGKSKVLKSLKKGTKVNCYATKKVGKNTWWAINSAKSQWACAIYNGKAYIK